MNHSTKSLSVVILKTMISKMNKPNINFNKVENGQLLYKHESLANQKVPFFHAILLSKYQSYLSQL